MSLDEEMLIIVGENYENCHFWAEHERRYRYHEWVPVPMVHFGTEEKWYGTT